MFRNVKYSYTTNNLAGLRNKYNLQICFRRPLIFLKLQRIISKGLSNRLVTRSNYIKSYKQLRMYYIGRLRQMFLHETFKTPTTFAYTGYKNLSYFLETYEQFLSLNCLDRALLWRATQLNTMFKITHTEKKKKKKFFYTARINFLKPEKRILIVWRWLSVFIRAFLEKDKQWGVALGPGLENFLMSQPYTHVLSDVKLQVYKLQLLRTA